MGNKRGGLGKKGGGLGKKCILVGKKLNSLGNFFCIICKGAAKLGYTQTRAAKLVRNCMRQRIRQRIANLARLMIQGPPGTVHVQSQLTSCESSWSWKRMQLELEAEPTPNIHLQQQQQLDYQCAFKAAAAAAFRAAASREAGLAGLERRPQKTRRTRIIYC